jgi:hypothetical protein
MAARSGSWPNPLDDPLAVAVGGLLLVLLVRLGQLPLALGLLVGVGATLGLVALRARHRPRSRFERLHDQRLEAGIDTALARAQELALQAASLRQEAMVRFTDSAHLEALGTVQLCCDRLAALPDRLRERRPLLDSGGGVLLPAENLAGRLAREEQALRQETEGPLLQERRRLVEQLRRNVEAARLGMDEREARLLALATRLEAIDGGLYHLRRQIDRQWPSTEATAGVMAGAVAAAIDPLDEALDQIERLLEAGVS